MLEHQKFSLLCLSEIAANIFFNVGIKRKGLQVPYFPFQEKMPWYAICVCFKKLYYGR